MNFGRRMMPHSTLPSHGTGHQKDDNGDHLHEDFLPPPPVEQRQTSDNERSMTPTRGEIVSFGDDDVLCGRGAPNIHHPGNRYFRSLVKARQEEYGQLRRPEKTAVVASILNAIERRGGRFLRQLSSGEWEEVHNAIAYEKVCQALREYQKSRNKQLKSCRPKSTPKR